MSVLLTILCRVIKNRLDAGQQFETIIIDYPKLSTVDITKIKTVLNIQTI